jgi:DNA polymerase-3 subunit chi
MENVFKPPAFMTRIDFHSNVTDSIAYACRLARKARAGGFRVVMMAADPAQQAQLDDALWRVSDADFLPHVAIGDPLANRTPIVLTCADTEETPHHEVLVNLSPRMPAHFARFARLIEIIARDDADKLAGRERFAFYKQRGYPLTHFEAEKS